VTADANGKLDVCSWSVVVFVGRIVGFSVTSSTFPQCRLKGRLVVVSIWTIVSQPLSLVVQQLWEV